MKYASLLMAAAVALSAAAAQAESTLDTVIQSKVLRCGIMMDNPPSGFRDANNQPMGFDVEYCNDMAAILGATPEIVEVTSPDRIPALVSNRIDVLVASTTPTPARAMTAAFTQPYMNFTMGVITRDGTGIASYDDLKDKNLGGVIGSTPEQLIASEIEKHGWTAQYTGYSSDADAYIALQQGKVDALIFSMTVFNALEQSGQFPEFKVAGLAPLADPVSIAVTRGDQEFLNWAKLFVWNQRVNGRFEELYRKYFGEGPLPSMAFEGTDF